MSSRAVQAEDARSSWMHAAHGTALPKMQRFMRTRVQAHAADNPTGVAVTWLGTSSGAPTRTRNNSGIALRAASGPSRDDIMLVDAGTFPPISPTTHLQRHRGGHTWS